jgi:NADPH2 dehydrogenase
VIANIFDPVTVSGLPFRNRIVLSPYIENQANRDGTVTPQMLNYYVSAAREGAGLIIIESAYVAEQGRASMSQLGISSERHTEGLYRLVKAIQAEGAAVGLRLAHAGARTSELIAGEQPVGPSLINFGKDFDVSREFDEGDVEEIVMLFVHAAERAEEVEADLIEINGAQQFLLDQCLSSRYNTRYDEYGGSTQERMQLPVAILKAINQRVSNTLPVSYYFSIHDKLEDGFTDADLKTVLHSLTLGKVNLLHPVTIHVMNKFFDADETLIEWVNRFSKKPVVADGNIKSPQILKEALALNKGALFALDRALFTRPNWHSFLQKKLLP